LIIVKPLGIPVAENVPWKWGVDISGRPKNFLFTIALIQGIFGKTPTIP
jgi:hypothetical protein